MTSRKLMYYRGPEPVAHLRSPPVSGSGDGKATEEILTTPLDICDVSRHEDRTSTRAPDGLGL
jgi:hypothetical protein